MHLSKSDAVKLFLALNMSGATKWTVGVLAKKLEVLPKWCSKKTVQPTDDVIAKRLYDVLAEFKAGRTVEVVEDEPETTEEATPSPEATGETPAPAVQESNGKPSKGKGKKGAGKKPTKEGKAEPPAAVKDAVGKLKAKKKPQKAAGNGKASQTRYELFGHPITAVLRAMGKDGWSALDASKAVHAMGIECSDNTVKTQVYRGKKGVMEPAPLSKGNLQELKKALGGETPKANKGKGKKKGPIAETVGTD
jgi:hypothetical protein